MADDATQPTLHHRRTFSSPESLTSSSDSEPLVSSIFCSGRLSIFGDEVCFQHHSNVLFVRPRHCSNGMWLVC